MFYINFLYFFWKRKELEIPKTHFKWQKIIRNLIICKNLKIKNIYVILAKYNRKYEEYYKIKINIL